MKCQKVGTTQKIKINSNNLQIVFFLFSLFQSRSKIKSKSQIYLHQN